MLSSIRCKLMFVFECLKGTSNPKSTLGLHPKLVFSVSLNRAISLLRYASQKPKSCSWMILLFLPHKTNKSISDSFIFWLCLSHSIYLSLSHYSSGLHYPYAHHTCLLTCHPSLSISHLHSIVTKVLSPKDANQNNQPHYPDLHTTYQTYTHSLPFKMLPGFSFV